MSQHPIQKGPPKTDRFPGNVTSRPLEGAITPSQSLGGRALWVDKGTATSRFRELWVLCVIVLHSKG